MSLVTYADLQTQVANWLARDDLAVYIPDMITLFECAAARKLKVRLQETQITLATTNGIGTLPSDFLGYRDVTWDGTSYTVALEYVTPTVFEAEWPQNDSGIPVVFTLTGGSIKIKPLDDSGLLFTYFQKPAALSGTLNWLWTTYPDAYLFGTLAEANAFNKAVDPAGLWKARRDEVFDEIFKVDFNERQGMRIRILGITP